VNKPVIVLVNSPEDFADMRGLGASTFIVGSDQGFVKTTARKMLDTYGAGAVAGK
jgi:2-keto-3-deoxy-L-rhamnonate aldolase RhmA